MPRLNNFLSLAIILFISACGTTKNSIVVQNIKKISDIGNNSLFYTLPKTKIIVAVEIIKVNNVPGMFAAYSQKYLGVDNNIKSNETYWSINNISFYSTPVTDTANSFIINVKNDFSLLPFKFTKEGFPISFNLPDYDYKIPELSFNSMILNTQNSGKLNFSFFSQSKTYKIVYDTTFREQIIDTQVLKLPVLQPSVAMKTSDEQAKDIADKLDNLREDRYLLIVSQSDKQPATADVFNKMLNETDKLQQEYISDFMGYSDTTKYTFYFTYVPTENDFDTSITLFKFSAKSGILSINENEGTIAYLNISANKYFSNQLRLYNSNVNFVNEKQKEANTVFKYRKPLKAQLSITLNSKIIAETKLTVAQLGAVENLPSNVFLSNSLKIKFNPEYGSIESIQY